jgi:hypothetical protein
MQNLKTKTLQQVENMPMEKTKIKACKIIKLAVQAY